MQVGKTIQTKRGQIRKVTVGMVKEFGTKTHYGHNTKVISIFLMKDICCDTIRQGKGCNEYPVFAERFGCSLADAQIKLHYS